MFNYFWNFVHAVITFSEQFVPTVVFNEKLSLKKGKSHFLYNIPSSQIKYYLIWQKFCTERGRLHFEGSYFSVLTLDPAEL